MIIKGSIRTGGRALARHLLNAHENEHVELVELDGFAGQSLAAALIEIEAVSKATQAQKPLFSVSFNAPETEQVSDEQYFDAFARVEKKLGLVGQPRAIVAHEKEGRRHFHVVWSRIDGEKFKAIELPHFKLKCTDISKQLYELYQWPMPPGLIDHKLKQTTNLKTAEYMQLKRQQVDPEELRQNCLDAWSVSDNLNSFKHALAERNLYLARGDKRGFVVLDHNAKVYSLSRFSGIKVKELKQKLGLPGQLPSIKETEKKITSFVTRSMLSEIAELKRQHRLDVQELREQRAILVHIHRAERRELIDQQRIKRRLLSTRAKNRFNSGLMRFFDRFASSDKLVRLLHRNEFNELETQQAESRQMMRFRQNQVRAELQRQIEEIRYLHRKQRMELAKNLVTIRRGELEQIVTQAQEEFQRKAEKLRKQVPRIVNEYANAAKSDNTEQVSKKHYKRKAAKTLKERLASRKEAKVLKRKRHNPRFLQFLRREQSKPEYVEGFNSVARTDKEKREQKTSRKQIFVPKME